MITLYWRRKCPSELDKRGLAKAIGRIIPMVVECHKAVTRISKDIKVDSQLILK